MILFIYLNFINMFLEQVNKLKTNWKDILIKIISNLSELEKIQIEKENGKIIYPPLNLIFNAFNQFNFEELNIIIIGQDPYHGESQANGLSFSVNDEIKIPPSLKNIFKEIYNDLEEPFILPKSGNLEYLAKQGILLLNNTLTVEKSKPNSHRKYWQGFSKEIIEYICKNSSFKIFLLWGGNAKSMKKYITGNHYYLESNHPSPLSANKGGWWGNKHFSKCNEILFELGDEQIDWIKK